MLIIEYKRQKRNNNFCSLLSTASHDQIPQILLKNLTRSHNFESHQTAWFLYKKFNNEQDYA